jgi:hypothetical protein
MIFFYNLQNFKKIKILGQGAYHCRLSYDDVKKYKREITAVDLKKNSDILYKFRKKRRRKKKNENKL